MKITIKIAVIAMMGMSLEVNAQHNYDNRNTIYSRDGNVGIGTSSPTSALHVNGNIQFDRKTGFFVNDAFDVSGNSVAHYGMSRISGTGYHYIGLSGYFGLNFYTEGKERIKVLRNGNVGIGTTKPTAKLAVNGKIYTKEVRVDLNLSDWADFVFEKEYNLPTLKEVENHIKEKGHLKDIPSAKEVEQNGIYLGEMDAKLLQKIEELTLYTIEQEKKIKALEKEKAENKKQDSKIDKQQKEIDELKALVQKLLKDKN
jgi:hypothetical protein